MQNTQKNAVAVGDTNGSLLVIPDCPRCTEILKQEEISEMFKSRLQHLSREIQELKEANRTLLDHLQYRILLSARCNNFIAELAKKLSIINSSIPEEKKFCRENIENCICQLKLFMNQSIWNEFKLRFAETHTDFYDKLLDKYSNLTVNDLRLCAFIKLKMSTKEIAAVLNHPVNSIKVARKRLREKLRMDAAETLINFMASF